LLGGSQALLAHSSDKDRMRVKTLGCGAVKATDRDGRILISSLMNAEIIWKVK
jgi:hypothetical protein